MVFDAKTREAIEEGKNRVTLLESEVSRLGRLKQTMEVEIRKLHTEKDYLMDKTVRMLGEQDAIGKEVTSLKGEQKALDEANARSAESFTTIQKNLAERETTLAKKESELLRAQEVFDHKLEILAEEVSSVRIERETLAEKKVKIENILKEI